MDRLRWVRLAFFSWLCFVCGCAVTKKEVASIEKVPGLAFVHVNVIPMDSERVLTNQNVIIREGRIAKMGPADRIEIPTGMDRIEAGGKYLLPAYADMHVHMLGNTWNMLFPPEGQTNIGPVEFNRFLLPYIANGVTTVMVMSATDDHLILRDQIRQGEVLGPRLILARMIDAPQKAWPPPINTWVATPDQARQAVLEAKKSGYDKMKVYTFLDRPCYDAIIATAKEQNMEVVGHIPNAVGLDHVLQSGQGLIAHAEESMRATKGDYSPERIQQDATAISKSGTWMTPTLLTTRTILAVFDGFEKQLARHEVRYFMHPMQQGVWAFIVEKLYAPIPKQFQEAIAQGFTEYQIPLVRALASKNVKLLAGTDTLLPGLVPGFALHRELEELVAAGLTPFQALRASTTYPMEYIGELNQAGTVSQGKRANLVLLSKNPLESISNTRSIEGVMINDRYLTEKELQSKLDELAKHYTTSQQ